jgi:hypothetical protein
LAPSASFEELTPKRMLYHPSRGLALPIRRLIRRRTSDGSPLWNAGTQRAGTLEHPVLCRGGGEWLRSAWEVHQLVDEDDLLQTSGDGDDVDGGRQDREEDGGPYLPNGHLEMTRLFLY